MPETGHLAPSLRQDEVVAGGPGHSPGLQGGSPSVDTHSGSCASPVWPRPSVLPNGPLPLRVLRAAWKIKGDHRPGQASPWSSHPAVPSSLMTGVRGRLGWCCFLVLAPLPNWSLPHSLGCLGPGDPFPLDVLSVIPRMMAALLPRGNTSICFFKQRGLSLFPGAKK